MKSSIRLLTPIVTISVLLVLGLSFALMVVDSAQYWKSIAASAFILLAAFVSLRSTRSVTLASSAARRIRIAFIVASIMIASQLAFAVARANGWFGDDGDPRLWSLQWFLVALVAVTIEVLSVDTKREQKDKD